MDAVKKIAVLVLVLYLAGLVLKRETLAAEKPATVSAQAAAPAKIDYVLPYQGLLPDSPIYFLKVIRDQLVLWLVQDERQKAFYSLLLSDKRLVAGENLINKINKDNKSSNIGVTSVVKAEEYFGQAVDLALTAKDRGMDTSDLFAKLTVAAAKHEEVLRELLNKVGNKDSGKVAEAYQKNQKSLNRVREVLYQMMTSPK